MMTAPVWVLELAEHFWSLAGPPPAFPRDLSRALTNATPLSLIALDDLSVTRLTKYLTKHRLPVPESGFDRPLRGALYCWRGSGFLFLDRADPPCEQRFSLAHELAHFLRDSDSIRRRVAKSLGIAAVEVLDGRPATTDERIAACLRGIPLAPHLHLMSRTTLGRPASDAEQEAEARADRLAFELLAPAREFVGETSTAALVVQLVEHYGLPCTSAQTYAGRLLPEERIGERIITRILKSC